MGYYHSIVIPGLVRSSDAFFLLRATEDKDRERSMTEKKSKERHFEASFMFSAM
jgi:hypothetical protein